MANSTGLRSLFLFGWIKTKNGKKSQREFHFSPCDFFRSMIKFPGVSII